MLAVRVIPTILKSGAKLIKGEGFADRVVGHAMQAARVHGSREVDELMILDVAATPNRTEPDYAELEQLADQLFIPLTVGGGVRTVEQVKTLLRCGADKVAVCSAALELPSFLSQVADQFGSQAIIAAIDVKGRTVFSHRGTRAWPMDVVTWAVECERRGAGEILLTDIERDGTMCGYNLDLIEEVAKAITIPLIVAGGCSGPDDMVAAIQRGASAVAAGALYQFTDLTPREASRHLSAAGMETRL